MMRNPERIVRNQASPFFLTTFNREVPMAQ